MTAPVPLRSRAKRNGLKRVGPSGPSGLSLPGAADGWLLSRSWRRPEGVPVCGAYPPFLAQNKILQLDPNRPIYAPAEAYVDLFVGYNTKLFNDKVRARFQLNVKNVQEDGGGLLKTSAFFDGKPSTYRIVDPRQFILTASFDL